MDRALDVRLVDLLHAPLLFFRRQSVPIPNRAVFDGLLDFRNDRFQVGTASRLGNTLPVQLRFDGQSDDDAVGVSQDEDQLGAHHHTGKFQTAQYGAVDMVAADARAEQIPETHIEHHLDWSARTSGAQHDGQRMLGVGRGESLPRQIAGQQFALAESLVAVPEDLNDLIRRQTGLHFKGRVVSELDVVLDLFVVVFESAQTDDHSVSRRGFIPILHDQIKHIRVDVIGAAGIDQHVPAVRHASQRVGQGDPVQETDVLREFDVEDFAPDMLLVNLAHRATQVAVEDENDAESQADQNPQQQIRQQDGCHGDEERQELIPALAPHLLEQLRTGQLQTRQNQDGRQAGQGDLVQPRRDQSHTENQQRAVYQRGQFGLTTGVDVHAAADDHRRNRQTTDQPGSHVANALRNQLAVGGRDPLLAVEFVDGFQIQERFDRRHQADGDRRDVDLGVGKGREIRVGQYVEPAGHAFDDFHLDSVRLLQQPQATQTRR